MPIQVRHDPVNQVMNLAQQAGVGQRTVNEQNLLIQQQQMKLRERELELQREAQQFNQGRAVATDLNTMRRQEADFEYEQKKNEWYQDYQTKRLDQSDSQFSQRQAQQGEQFNQTMKQTAEIQRQTQKHRNAQQQFEVNKQKTQASYMQHLIDAPKREQLKIIQKLNAVDEQEMPEFQSRALKMSIMSGLPIRDVMNLVDPSVRIGDYAKVMSMIPKDMLDNVQPQYEAEAAKLLAVTMRLVDLQAKRMGISQEEIDAARAALPRNVDPNADPAFGGANQLDLSKINWAEYGRDPSAGPPAPPARPQSPSQDYNQVDWSGANPAR